MAEVEGNIAADHEFGDQHTDLKLSVVEGYLKAYTTALRPHFKQLWYIDAFAGTGKRTVRVDARDGDLIDGPTPGRVEQRRGSAQIAIDVKPAFDRIVFIETKPAHCAALKSLAEKSPGRDIDIVEEDANRAIQGEIEWDGWASTRAVMFLDPYGMDVEWATLEAIAKTKAIDVWFLFSLSGLYRQATRKAIDLSPDKRNALNRIFGDSSWEQELYTNSPQTSLFGDEERQRGLDVKGLERYVQKKLGTIFSKVLNPLALPIKQKPQRFSLFFAISNPEPKAIGLATKIAAHMLAAGNSSHKRPL